MNPWTILGNLAAWSLIVVLVLFMALIVWGVIVSLFKKANGKHPSKDRRITVFAGKRQD